MRYPKGLNGLVLVSQISYLAFVVSGIRNIWLAKVLLPSFLASNSLSSLLIALGLFMDFGAVFSIRRVVPKKRALKESALEDLSTIKNSMVYSITIFSLLLFATSLILYVSGKPELALGFIAASLILPIQSISNYRSAVYVSIGKNSRSSYLLLSSVSINFIATIILLPLVHELVILITPIIGYTLALVVDSKVPGHLELPRGFFKAGMNAFAKLAIQNRGLLRLQVLAFLLVTIESWLAYIFLSLRDAAILGLIANLTAAISVYPVTFSNQLQTRLSIGESSLAWMKLYSILEKARSFLLETLAFVSLIGGISMTWLIANFLPTYHDGIYSLWIMTLATYFYGSTFYSSNYPILIGVERQISKIQSYSLTFVAVSSSTLVVFGWFSLVNLCFIALIKSLIYFFMTSRTLFQTSNGKLSAPMRQTSFLLLRSMPIMLCTVTAFSSSPYIFTLALLTEALFLCLRLLPSSRNFFTELRKDS